MEDRIHHPTTPGSESPPLSFLHELTVPSSSPPLSTGEHIHISISSLEGSPGHTFPSSPSSSDRNSIDHGLSPEHNKSTSPGFQPPPVVKLNRHVFEEPVTVVTKTDRSGREESRPRGARRSLSILSSAKRKKVVIKAALGFRVFGFLFCLVSFSVMASDRNQGWALDSFDRYKEFRYSVTVNAIGFVYSVAQAMDLSYSLATGKYAVQHKKQLRHYFDFSFDQIISYLLISASSSATVRVDDWKSNWGKDKFPDVASVAVSMSFLAFAALAFSSLISGYALCTS